MKNKIMHTSSGSVILNSQPSPVQLIKLWLILSDKSSNKNCQSWIGPPVGGMIPVEFADGTGTVTPPPLLLFCGEYRVPGGGGGEQFIPVGKAPTPDTEGSPPDVDTVVIESG